VGAGYSRQLAAGDLTGPFYPSENLDEIGASPTGHGGLKARAATGGIRCSVQTAAGMDELLEASAAGGDAPGRADGFEAVADLPACRGPREISSTVMHSSSSLGTCHSGADQQGLGLAAQG